jgi:two-component system, cell cycle response regulator
MPKQKEQRQDSTAAPLKVLVVEDERDIREIVTRLVSGMGYAVAVAMDGVEAMQRLREQCPDIVLLDIMMPQMDGFEFCRQVQADETFRDLHIIITSAKDALQDKVKGLELGAADYLTKPFSLTELKARIQVGERLVRYRKTLQDQQVRLEHLAREDELTGLYNRRYFEERATAEWLRANRYGRPLAMLLGDLDYFKRVNDGYGHGTGDVVLRRVAQLQLQHCRNSDTVARYGGEEFVILLSETKLEEAQLVAERLCEEVRNLKFTHSSGTFGVTISYGVATFQNGDENPHTLVELIEQADKALYEAKRKGRNRAECYHASKLPVSPTVAARK